MATVQIKRKIATGGLVLKTWHCRIPHPGTKWTGEKGVRYTLARLELCKPNYRNASIPGQCLARVNVGHGLSARQAVALARRVEKSPNLIGEDPRIEPVMQVDEVYGVVRGSGRHTLSAIIFSHQLGHRHKVLAVIRVGTLTAEQASELADKVRRDPSLIGTRGVEDWRDRADYPSFELKSGAQ